MNDNKINMVSTYWLVFLHWIFTQFSVVTAISTSSYRYVNEATVVLQDEWRFLLAGGSAIPKEIENPAQDWLSDRAWSEILRLPILVSANVMVKSSGPSDRSLSRFL